MPDVYLARTNQKLSFARIHLEQLVQAQDSNGWEKHSLIESFNESVLFHLASAYQSFLREVAERYRFNPETVSGLLDLERGLEAAGVESPEFAELSVLEKDRFSWLSQMSAAYAACWAASNNRSDTASVSGSISEIHVKQINPDHSEDKALVDEYAGWLQQMKDLVERHRSSMQEW